jgi:hypothetical protein
MYKLFSVVGLVSGTLFFVNSAGSAQALQVLNFEGIADSYPFPNETLIGEFYNGAGGPDNNFGISFSSNALNICLNSVDVFCSNTSRGGQGNPNSQTGGLFFLTGSESTMSREAGFQNGFSFFYTAINNAGSFSVYDGLNGTGNILASAALPTTTSGPCSGYVADFCPFVPFGVSFEGVAKSVAFAGVANQIVFDDVTFGSSIPDPTPIPEPLTILGSASALGFGAFFKRKLKSSKSTVKETINVG